MGFMAEWHTIKLCLGKIAQQPVSTEKFSECPNPVVLPAHADGWVNCQCGTASAPCVVLQNQPSWCLPVMRKTGAVFFVLFCFISFYINLQSKLNSPMSNEVQRQTEGRIRRSEPKVVSNLISGLGTLHLFLLFILPHATTLDIGSRCTFTGLMACSACLGSHRGQNSSGWYPSGSPSFVWGHPRRLLAWGTRSCLQFCPGHLTPTSYFSPCLAERHHSVVHLVQMHAYEW